MNIKSYLCGMLAKKQNSESRGNRLSLQDHAVDNLQFIRTTMERAGSFTAVSGKGAILMGVMAMVAAYWASRQAQEQNWLLIWILAAGVAMAVAIVATHFKAKSLGLALFSAVSRRFFLGLLPPIVAGMALTLLFVSKDFTVYLPGMWLLLYGTGIVTAGIFSVRLIPAMGFCFMIAGVISFLLPMTLRDWVMALGFGGIHVIFGFIIMRKYNG